MAKYISKCVTMRYFTILHHSTQFSSNNPSDAEALKGDNRTLDQIKFSFYIIHNSKQETIYKNEKYNNK